MHFYARTIRATVLITFCVRRREPSSDGPFQQKYRVYYIITRTLGKPTPIAVIMILDYFFWPYRKVTAECAGKYSCLGSLPGHVDSFFELRTVVSI